MNLSALLLLVLCTCNRLTKTCKDKCIDLYLLSDIFNVFKAGTCIIWSVCIYLAINNDKSFEICRFKIQLLNLFMDGGFWKFLSLSKVIHLAGGAMSISDSI